MTAAAQWSNGLVDRLNAEFRQQIIQESGRGIQYLKERIQQTSLAHLRTVLYRDIERHTKNITLAKVNEQHALKVINPAVPPQARLRPKRTQMVQLGLFLGLMVGAFDAFLSKVIQQQRQSREQGGTQPG